MADGAVVPFPAAIFESDYFGRAIMVHHFRDDLGSSNGGLADLNFAVLNNQKYVGELGRGPGGGGKAFNLKGLAFADLVLFTSGTDDGDVCHKE